MRLLYPLVKRFIAGYDFESAKGNINKLLNDGFEVSVDYLGELSETNEDCERALNQYIDIIEFYKDVSINISIKPTQLGLKINPYISYKKIDKIAKLAKRYGHSIRLDMEDSSVTELTRNLAISLNKKYGNVGVAIQSNLFRTEEDIRILTESKVSVRLVKGAYKESEKISHTDEKAIKKAFIKYATDLKLNKANHPAIGTHDEELLNNISDKYFDYEFLYGIRRDLQRKFRDDGHAVRVYVPFGSSWMPYIIRRLKEWKNLKFVITNIVKEWRRKV